MTIGAAVLRSTAPAKVNLCLHVGPTGADGFHPLASLVVFADVGDGLTAQVGHGLSLVVEGPFGAALAGEGDNLVLRAARAVAAAASVRPDIAFTLDKRLPVASGLGGGSADAAAALRLTRDLLAPGMEDAVLERLAFDLGADVAMCVRSRPAWAEGRGERLEPVDWLPPLPAVLANPGLPSPTGAVYRAYDAGPPRSADRPRPPADRSVEGVIDWLGIQRNDLEAPSIGLTSGAGEALRTLAATDGVRLARMSGSGASVFGLCATVEAAEAAADALRCQHGDWWAVATLLGDGKAKAKV